MKHKVDMYICGHIHNFQHIRIPESEIDYVVNSSGFSVCSMDKKEFNLRMIDKKGNILYTVTRKK